MRRILFVSSFIMFSTLIFSCSSEKKESDRTNENIADRSTNTVIINSGFESVNGLTQSLIETIKTKDYETYITHVMSREQELAQSKLIENDSVRQIFINEFSFSLHEEENYFNNMIKYLNDSEINLDRLIIEESIVIEYEDNVYAPCELVEVIIPIEHDAMEIDLVYVAIKIDGSWFLTAELGI